ncbi:peptidylprolyl isomerase [Neisseria montereyensis]|uniref:peptidylprolyl isomerase n=1 Tax=Neisseria montereyensis TaxID=2973938 RepID=A0ABT2F9C6_9NEIS|nr:peptidyl-prolyl cis-trans isomerase [Neisseria montereyensis]MCS4532804.1 peptidyl-prolyl cis-trans isomerase [Neisseria montereyensis]
MKKSYFALALLTTLISGSLWAKTLVTVNGTKIDSSEIDGQVKILQSQNPQIPDSPALRQELTQRQVMATVVAQEAKRLKLDQSAEYKKAIADARAAAKKDGVDKQSTFKQQWASFENEMLNRAFIAHTLSTNPISEKDLQTAYNDFKNFYQGSYEVQLGEIITRSRADAEKAIADLKAKKSFKTVANQYSIDPESKQNGGLNQDYVNLKDLEQGAPNIYSAVGRLNKGGYTTTPLEGGNGVFGVFYVNDKRATKIPSYNDAKNGLAGQLQAERIDRAVETLLRKANIKSAN